jgi:uncharacterized protein YegP (UPF0339 family)
MIIDTGEAYTAEQAAIKALEWCKQNPGWKRICDIENTDALHHNLM